MGAFVDNAGWMDASVGNSVSFMNGSVDVSVVGSLDTESTREGKSSTDVEADSDAVSSSDSISGEEETSFI